MNRVTAGLRKPARISGPVGFLLIGLACCPLGAHAQDQSRPASATHRSDHATALAALKDIKLAIGSIVAAENDSSSGPGNFKTDAQQAVNALVGHGDAAYRAAGDSTSDKAGAIGDIDHLLDRTASPPWVPALHGALANIEAALARLQDAQNAKGLMRYQIAISQALINLEVAEGRRSELGVLGGMKGAIANTALAVPGGAKVVDGCAVPRIAPAYGVHAGYLVFRTTRLGKGNQWTIDNPGGTTISSTNGFLVFHLPASVRTSQICATSKPDRQGFNSKGSTHASE
jgi:polar amino acid transport system substrate-binding protein